MTDSNRLILEVKISRANQTHPTRDATYYPSNGKERGSHCWAERRTPAKHSARSRKACSRHHAGVANSLHALYQKQRYKVNKLNYTLPLFSKWPFYRFNFADSIVKLISKLCQTIWCIIVRNFAKLREHRNLFHERLILFRLVFFVKEIEPFNVRRILDDS